MYEAFILRSDFTRNYYWDGLKEEEKKIRRIKHSLIAGTNEPDRGRRVIASDIEKRNSSEYTRERERERSYLFRVWFNVTPMECALYFIIFFFFLKKTGTPEENEFFRSGNNNYYSRTENGYVCFGESDGFLSRYPIVRAKTFLTGGGGETKKK